MEEFLRTATPGGGSNETLKQADSIWRMLDQMAEDDPENYKKFIDQNLSQGKELFKMPEPYAVAVTHTIKPNGSLHQRVFINLFSWSRVPTPMSDDEKCPIPMTGAKCTRDTPNDTIVCCAAFASKTMEEMSKKRMDEGLGVLVHLSMRYLEQNCGVPKMALSFKILEGQKFGGSKVENLRKALMESEDAVSARQGLGQMMSQFDKVPQAQKEEMLKRVSDARKARESGNSSQSSTPEIRIPGSMESEPGKPKKKLVQELKPGDRPLQRPVHSVEKVREKNQDGVMETIIQVSMALPQLSTSADLEVDVGVDDVSVFVPDRYATEIVLPDRVDRDAARAVFVRKSKILRLQLPLLQGAA